MCIAANCKDWLRTLRVPRLLHHELAHPEDGVERRPEIVADVADHQIADRILPVHLSYQTPQLLLCGLLPRLLRVASSLAVRRPGSRGGSNRGETFLRRLIAVGGPRL